MTFFLILIVLLAAVSRIFILLSRAEGRRGIQMRDYVWTSLDEQKKDSLDVQLRMWNGFIIRPNIRRPRRKMMARYMTPDDSEEEISPDNVNMLDRGDHLNITVHEGSRSILRKR